jgi:SAM-dependent methyltransferase
VNAIPNPTKYRCKICRSETTFVGFKRGRRTGKTFELQQCAACGFAFVANPWTDFATIYDAEYYQGRGSDPLVDYVFELEHPEQTIRQYEWQGIVRVVSNLIPLTPQTQWLDFGCGNGGLVRYCRKTLGCEARGFEEGWIRDRAVKHGIPVFDRVALAREQHLFDVVTAIEVLEHAIEPLEVFRTVREMLKPGGLFFFTTGNLAPFANNLIRWPYVAPEIHVSFFEPRTLRRALEQTGFRAAFPGFLPGHENIIQFKLLKNFRLRRAAAWFSFAPWRLAAKFCDTRLQITALPVGWAGG